jgi:cation diffusion facilitator family transporter
MKRNLHRLAVLEGWLSIILNTALFVLKYWAGRESGSVAVMADAWHTLSDSLTSVVVIIGVIISAAPGDREHPFGHGRAELIASIIIGVLLGVVGFNFMTESIAKLRARESAQFGSTIIVVFAVSVVLKEAIAQFSLWAGRKTGSRSLKADGWHHRSDAIASALILIGGWAGARLWWMDGALGICVALLILYAAFDIVREGANPLMGAYPSVEFLNELYSLARRVTGTDLHIHHTHLHQYGDHGRSPSPS